MLRSARHKAALDTDGHISAGRFASSRGRRWRPGAAAAAYSLALTVLRDEQEAADVAADALQHGAHSRVGVLAHARHQALEQATEPTPADLDVLASADVREVARQLAATRPAIERAIVDLELRYGLDSSMFAGALGIAPERAAERARAVTETWSTHLDPAMVAWLGAGACAELEASLSASDLVTPMTVGGLLLAAPTVLEHSQSCSNCGERLRLLTPVKTLVGQMPPEAVPEAVAKSARNSRRRLASALPPSIEPRRLTANRARTLAIGGGAIIVIVAAIFGISAALDNRSESQADRVARLVQAAPTSRLLGTPTIMTPTSETAALANNGPEAIVWQAVTSESWLTVSPTTGRLAPSQSISIAVRASEIPVNSPSDAVITITGDEGSVQTIRYEASN